VWVGRCGKRVAWVDEPKDPHNHQERCNSLSLHSPMSSHSFLHARFATWPISNPPWASVTAQPAHTLAQGSSKSVPGLSPKGASCPPRLPSTFQH
jgi:hypothetical protein